MTIVAKMCRWNLCACQTRHSVIIIIIRFVKRQNVKRLPWRVGPVLLIEPCDLEQREIEPNIIVYKGAIAADRTFVHAVRLDLR